MLSCCCSLNDSWVENPVGRFAIDVGHDGVSPAVGKNLYWRNEPNANRSSIHDFWQGTGFEYKDKYWALNKEWNRKRVNMTQKPRGFLHQMLTLSG